MKKKNTLKIVAIIAGIAISIPLIAFAFLMLSGVITRAGGKTPTDVEVLRVQSTSATVSWLTSDDTEGTILYGTTPSQLRLVYPEIGSKSSHRVTLTLLKPSTTYYFAIRIGDDIYDNDGVPWKFTTTAAGEQGSKVPSPGVTEIIISPQRVTPGSSGSAQISPTGPDMGPTAIVQPSSCPITDNCDDIQKRLGKGCTSADYVKCLKKGQ